MLSAAVTRAHRSLFRSVLFRSVVFRPMLFRPRPGGLRRFPSRLWLALRLLQRQPQRERLDGSQPPTVDHWLQVGPSAHDPLWPLLPPSLHHPTPVSQQFRGLPLLRPVTGRPTPPQTCQPSSKLVLRERWKNGFADKPGVCFDIVGWTTLGEDDRLGSGLAVGVDLLDAVVG